MYYNGMDLGGSQEVSKWEDVQEDVQEKSATIRRRLVTLVLNELGEYVLPEFKKVIVEDTWVEDTWLSEMNT